MTTPYFYVIQEKSTGKYYAGSRYAEGCHPSDLLSSYFTSSKTVQSLIAEGSRFSILKIRVREDALDYETRFLRKVNASMNDRFINRHNNQKGFGCEKGMMAARNKETGECSRIPVEEYRNNPDKWKSLLVGNNFTGKSFVFFGQRWRSEREWERHYKSNRKTLHRYRETGILSPLMTNEEWVDVDTRKKKQNEYKHSNLKRGLEKCERDQYGKYLAIRG